MNLVFSDGFHSGDAVLVEVEGLLGRGIIRRGGAAGGGDDEDFVMVWDDCQGEILEVVSSKIFPRLREEFGAGRLTRRRTGCSHPLTDLRDKIGDGQRFDSPFRTARRRSLRRRARNNRPSHYARVPRRRAELPSPERRRASRRVA